MKRKRRASNKSLSFIVPDNESFYFTWVSTFNFSCGKKISSLRTTLQLIISKIKFNGDKSIMELVGFCASITSTMGIIIIELKIFYAVQMSKNL